MYTLSRRVNTYKPSTNLPSNALDQKALIDRIRPHQEVVLQTSAGHTGVSGKRQRAPEAAFAATTMLFSKIAELKLQDPIEVIMSDFGPTRQVFINTLYGREGSYIRPLIKRVTDGTKIKFGGDRSRNKPRK